MSLHRELPGDKSYVVALAISRNGRWVATGNVGGVMLLLDLTAQLWDLDRDSLLGRARVLAGREFTAVEE